MGLVATVKSRFGFDPKGSLKGSSKRSRPIRKVSLPFVQKDHKSALSTQGWTTLSLPMDSDLNVSMKQLLAASERFFAQEQQYKSNYSFPKEGSEQGWSRIEGEKELITLRTRDTTPPELLDAATNAWSAAASTLNEMLGRIAESLGLPASSLTQYSSPCTHFDNDRPATLLRLFRYEGDAVDKVVAEPHHDLGLLSMVYSETPGLEVWDRDARTFWPVEKEYQAWRSNPSQKAEKDYASVLVGRELERLTNRRYVAGGHQVKSYLPRPKYRYSIVLVMRAHSPVTVDTEILTTNITGPFPNPMKGITAGQMFLQIQRAHFNINTGTTERDQQRERLRTGKARTNPASTTESASGD